MTAPTDNLPLDPPHRDSLSSVSTTSLVFDYIEEQNQYKRAHSSVMPSEKPIDFPGDGDDEESVRFLNNESRHLRTSPRHRISKVWIWAGLGLSVMAVLALFSLVGSPANGADRTRLLTGNPVTLDSVLDGEWSARSRGIAWIAGPNGEDGLLMEQGAHGKDFLVVSDVRLRDANEANKSGLKEQTLIKSGSLSYHDIVFTPTKSWPNAQLTKVLVASSVRSHWRHSFTASYWIVDVATQEVMPLIPEEPRAIVQLATWSPTGDSIAFTRDNNLFTRAVLKDGKISATIKQVTKDGGREYFYGIPDWVYEEEVFSGNSATWWSDDGKFIAFLRTNESSVIEYPVDFFVSRPSGPAKEGQDLYPDVQQIKYPKAGTPNPVVELMFYSTEKGDVFTVNIDSEHRFADDDRLITTVLWAGDQVLVKETNRVSDIMHVVLIDPEARIGKTVQNINVKDIDGGWFEISTKTRYVPADSTNGRPHSGYIDTIIYNDRDHLAYFSPIDTDKPVMLTQGDYEVVDAPSAVDVKNNLVYFVSTQKSSIERHVYSVKLDGSDLKSLTNVSAEGYYDVSFSKGAGFALLSYRGPDIPWQKVVSTPSTPTKFSLDIENNAALSQKASETDLPTLVHGTIEVDGVLLNYVERRPANFDRNKKYPVLFQQYSGPGSQSVNKRFSVDFQSYVPSSLGYITVTVDGRGTGYIGRKNRVIVRGQLGVTESHDQIAAAKHWSQLDYVDAERLAIWGWSFGGFNTLKTLEQDSGQTFKYGMAVAPVTDWRFYDSIYTERYMLTPQMNADGYARSAVNNATALSQNVRFLVMHGTGDDNVHIQNTYTLLDRLDLEGVENYDVHVFPDSNHGIYFHGASRVIHDKLSNWLVNAFNGEWLKVDGAVPKPEMV